MESEKRATNNNDIHITSIQMTSTELCPERIKFFFDPKIWVTKKTKMTSGLVCENDLITEHVLSVCKVKTLHRIEVEP